MDAFESVIALLLRLEGYWTQTSFKVELTKEQKRAIGRHSSPRWEIDVVAYHGGKNEVLAVECKSYLDSMGVAFDGTALHPASSYKLFAETKTREIVLAALVDQLVVSGFCPATPSAKLCLAAGKLKHPKREAELVEHFQSNDWRLIGPAEISLRLSQCVDARYENDVAYVVAKILGRSSTLR